MTDDSGKTDMNRRHFLRQATLGTLGVSMSPGLFGTGSERRSAPPNIILFLTDDHARMDAGCYGNDAIDTPNIDRLASEGMRFDEAYSITATCVPARTSLYTGLGPHRHGSHENHSRLDQGISTLPHYLSELGYRVILAGKTHIRPLEAYPFEYIDTGGDWNAVIVKEGSEVGQFLSSEAARENPFCLVIATNNPHVPWPRENEYDPGEVNLHPFLLDTEDTRKAMANYYSDTTAMDRELGRVLDLLEENGLAGDTAVIYTSDQGPQFPHAKWELYDYGIHVPLIVRWAERVESGSVSDAMISSVDLLPTMIEMAGGSPPGDIDGKSFAGILQQQTGSHREIVFATHTRDLMMNYFPIRAVRNRRYKYILNLAPERAFTNHITNSNNFEENGGERLWDSWMELARRDPEARERVRFYQRRPGKELYDIQNDPHELDNLAEDPELEEVREELHDQLIRWMKQQGDDAAERI